MSNAIYADRALEIDRRESRLLLLAFVFLTFSSSAIAFAPAARLGDFSLVGVRLGQFFVLPVWAASAWLVRRFLRRSHPFRDPFLLPSGLTLAGWGMLIVWRLFPNFGARQTGWFLVSMVLLIEVLRSPADLRWLKRYRYLWLSGGISLALLTLVFGTNPSGGEPRLWLGCCGIYLQPSEPLRLLLLAFMASYLADRVTFAWGNRQIKLLPALGPLLVAWGLSVALLVAQRDLGTGTLFLALLAVMIFLASGRWHVLLLAALFGLFGGLLGFTFIHVVRQRVLAWLDPWGDPIGGAYQLVQSLIAIASGGVLGRGPGLGSPGFVPVAHSDFIFASVAEEWGMLGGLAMLALLAVLVGRGLRTAARTRDPFSGMLTAGIAIAYGLQSFMILGGVMRLLPLTGLTLPFVSYGGSSLVTSFIGLGFLILVSGKEPGPSKYIRPLGVVEALMLVGWASLALTLGWWSVVRAPDLTARTDNPRRGLAAMYVKRGRILDRQGVVLAESIGQRGEYTRHYAAPEAVSIVGYDSTRYGQVGVERALDPELRGEAGVDTLSLWWSRLLTGAPPPGSDVRLTLDLERQVRTVEALIGQRGAVVVLDAPSGDVRVLASSPTYDPNDLDERWESLTAREDGPLFNRATQGSYQPGMALAPFVYAWGHAMGLIKPDQPRGALTIPERINGVELTCSVNPPSAAFGGLELALRFGCPKPFADFAPRLGVDAFRTMLEAFGIDQGPAVRIETSSPAVDLERAGEDGLRLAVLGQGDLTVSPIQMARAFAVLAAKGVRPGLRTVDAVRRPDGSWEGMPALESAMEVLPPQSADQTLEALRSPSPGEVGYAALAIAGPDQRGLAWYLGASTDPSLVVAVVLEGGDLDEAQRIGRVALGIEDGGG